MSIDDLKQAGKDKVRNDSSLMSAYIDLFTQKFSRKPDCAGCTFNTDWQRLINSNIQKIETMSNNTFRLKNNAIIYSYDVEDKISKRIIRKRAYGNVMTEEFAKDFLTIGTQEDIEERKKLFAVLPQDFQNTKEDNEQGGNDLSKLTLTKLKEIAENKGYLKEEWENLKKDEIIVYLNAKELEAQDV